MRKITLIKSRYHVARQTGGDDTRSSYGSPDKALPLKAETGYAHIPHLKARATMFIKRNGFATMDNFIELGLSRQYVSQLCTRGILRRSGLLYTMPGQD